VTRYLPLLLNLLRAFNAISFVLVAILHFRERRQPRSIWGGGAYRALVVALAVLYLDVLGEELAQATLGRSGSFLLLIDDLLSMLLPAMVFHTYYCGERPYLRAHGVWRAVLAAAYISGLIAGIGGAGVVTGLWHTRIPKAAFGMPSITCAVLGVVGLLWASRRLASDPRERNHRRWVLGLSVAWGVVALAQELHWTIGVGIVLNSAPLIFLFIVTYYVERFTFFDVLLKKAAFAFASLLSLTLYFVFVTPFIWALRLHGWFGPVVWGVSVWPIILLAPWGHRTVSRWLDRLWLGRRFSPAQASEYFFAGVQGAIGERELARSAEQRLGTIFRSEAEVSLMPEPPAAALDRGNSIQAPLRLRGEPIGWICLRASADHPRLLSEDVELLASLAKGLSFLLENLRLREKRLEQEKRERELVLNANRSELKALRAQVNPHFLFNALNAIAGLIPEDPDRAERTIEQLAEVFRYTLRGSDREWVLLSDELDAVRAYLDIEQARFRERLRVRIECSEEAKGFRIPAMTVQTVVENAIKHGVAAIREPGVVEIEASVAHSALCIAVRDNGPGFEEARQPKPDNGGGFGLRNVRERLEGHFGGAARLSIGRDTGRGLTVVSIEMPAAAGWQRVEA